MASIYIYKYNNYFNKFKILNNQILTIYVLSKMTLKKQDKR